MKKELSILALFVTLIFSACAKKDDAAPADPNPEYYLKINIDGRTVDYTQKKQDSLVVKVDGITTGVFAVTAANQNCRNNGVPCFNFSFAMAGDTIPTGSPRPVYFLSVDFINQNQLGQYQYTNSIGGVYTDLKVNITSFTKGLNGGLSIVKGTFSGTIMRVADWLTTGANIPAQGSFYLPFKER